MTTIDDGGKVQAVVAGISELSVIELNALKEALYEKFGVKDHQAPVWDNRGPSAPVEEVEEQTEFTVLLSEIGPAKLEVIKTVRAVTGLGLKEAKELVDATPSIIKEGISLEEAENLKSAIIASGAVVIIK